MIDCKLIDDNYQDLFETYLNYKTILFESIYTNNYYSDTIDEIIKYIDYFLSHFRNKKSLHHLKRQV